MSAPQLLTYIAPESRSRQPTNNFHTCCVTVDGRRYRYSRGRHGGSDVKPRVVGRAGDMILAGWPGRVIAIGDVWGAAFGRQMLLEHYYAHGPDAFHPSRHLHRWYSFHAHLSGYRVALGREVAHTTAIASMGATGNVTNVHDHFEVHLYAEYDAGLIDPFSILERARLGSSPPAGGGDMTLSAADLLKIESIVRNEVQRTVQFLALGVENKSFDSSIDGWVNQAKPNTLPHVVKKGDV